VDPLLSRGVHAAFERSGELGRSYVAFDGESVL